MKTYLKYPIIACIGLLLMHCSHVNKKDDKNEDKEVTEKTINLMEPDHAFSLALEAFAKSDYEKSADEIRKGIKVMESIAKVATGEHQKKIQDSIEELQDLAEDVRIDHVEGINELNYFFGKAGRALAGNRVYISRKEFSTLSPQQAGDSILKAIDQVIGTLQYNNREMNDDELSMINKARSLADSLKNGKEINHIEIEMTYDQLQNKLDDWSMEFSDEKFSKNEHDKH